MPFGDYLRGSQEIANSPYFLILFKAVQTDPELLIRTGLISVNVQKPVQMFRHSLFGDYLRGPQEIANGGNILSLFKPVLRDSELSIRIGLRSLEVEKPVQLFRRSPFGDYLRGSQEIANSPYVLTLFKAVQTDSELLIRTGLI